MVRVVRTREVVVLPVDDSFWTLRSAVARTRSFRSSRLYRCLFQLFNRIGEYHMSSGSSGKRVIDPPLFVSICNRLGILFR